MLADDRLVLCQIDAERLVVGDVAFHPLDLLADLLQRIVRLGGGAAQLIAVEASDLRYVPLDDEFTQGQDNLLSSVSTLRSKAKNARLPSAIMAQTTTQMP